jgi:aerobic carbon-monoxide dehydrogenase small subunit
MTETIAICVTVNGVRHAIDVPANLLLVDLLRERLNLRGTKVACDQGVCGACTVLADGAPMTSCLTFAFAVDGQELTTIEGVGGAGSRDPVQQAFYDCGVPQCGFCTPGMVMLTKAPLDRAPDADAGEIDRWLSANVCRCSGYQVFRRALCGAGEGDPR